MVVDKVCLCLSQVVGLLHANQTRTKCEGENVKTNFLATLQKLNE